MTRAVRVAALTVASALVTITILVLTDRLIVSRAVPPRSLIFPPHHEFRYRSSEFSAVAHTNAMGFRDRELGIEAPPGVTRVLAIGDSFTFGWGVEDDEAWPKVLERRLMAAGARVEIANLGAPGNGPDGYETVARNAIPRLHPSLTIVAVLQGDDLVQALAEPDAPPPRPSGWKAAAHALVPNLLALRSLWRGGVADDPMEFVWKQDVQDALAAYTPEQRARFAALDDEVRRDFLEGTLNPGLLEYVVAAPDSLLNVDDLEGAAARSAMARMGRHIAAIGRVASANGSDLIVVGLPYGPYASPRDYRNAEHVGYRLTPDMWSSTRADEAIRRASEQAGVRFVSIASELRNAAKARELFFALDGHYTREGHDVVATLVAPAVLSRVSGLRDAAR